MTDHEGNRKIYLARGIQEGLETADYCPRRSCALVNRNSWGGDPESLGQIDLPITLETSHYLFIIELLEICYHTQIQVNI